MNNAVWWNLPFTSFLGLLIDIPYMQKYAHTRYNTELNLLPEPIPLIATTTPTVAKELQASSSTLSQIVISPLTNTEEMKSTKIFKKYNVLYFTKTGTNSIIKQSNIYLDKTREQLKNYIIKVGYL